jgi:hypothetical protein
MNEYFMARSRFVAKIAARMQRFRPFARVVYETLTHGGHGVNLDGPDGNM